MAPFEKKSSISKKKIFITLFLLIFFSWLGIKGCSYIFYKEIKIFRIARDSTWDPIDLGGKEKNMDAFTNELIREISIEMGFNYQILSVGTNYLFENLNNGTYDAIFSSLDPTVQNKKRYEFSHPFYYLGPVLIVPENSDAKKLKDMEGKIIGIEKESSLVFNIKEYPNITIRTYTSRINALENLEEKQIDGVIMDIQYAYIYTQGFYKGKLKVGSPPLTNDGLRIIGLKNQYSDWIISQFNEGLERIKEKGIYKKLINKWDLIYIDDRE